MAIARRSSNGAGNRVAKTAGGVTTFYLVDTNNLTGYAQVVEELQSGVGVVKAYTYGHDLISQRQGSAVSFYSYDGHGSVRQLTNSSGHVTDTYAYDSFGSLIGRTGATDNNYLYSGEQFDPDTGYYYNRARYLNVETGRFMSADSFEGTLFGPLSHHKYLYGEGDPVNRIDPSGHSSINEVTGVRVASAPIQNMSMLQPMAVQGAMPLATVNAGTAMATAGTTAIVTAVSVRAVSFAVSFALATGSVIALKTLKKALTEDDDENYVFATLHRWTNELSPLGL